MTINKLKKIQISIFFILPLLIFGCYRVPDKIDPKLTYNVEERKLKQLPSAFAPLTIQERDQEWGKEYLIGLAFAKELDLYRAITAFKRAQILLPLSDNEREVEITYNIILSYYIGGRYEDVIDTFETSSLRYANQEFSAYHDLLVILFDSYEKVDAPEKAESVLKLIEEHYPESGQNLEIGLALTRGDLNCLSDLAKKFPNNANLAPILDCYTLNKKSVAKAQTLNIIPGAGYLYVGQTQSAITAFLLNGAFITAAYLFFKNGNAAAGIITTSIEAGWYFGGIYGAGEAAKLYNERLYEQITHQTLCQDKLYPALSLRYAF